MNILEGIKIKNKPNCDRHLIIYITVFILNSLLALEQISSFYLIFGGKNSILNNILGILPIIILLFLIINCYVTSDKFAFKKSYIRLVFFLLLTGFYSFLLLGSWCYEEFALLMLFSIGAYKLDSKKIFKSLLFAKVIMILVLEILLLCGIGENRIFYENGHIRYCFGFVYVLHFTGECLFLLLIFLFLYAEKIKAYGYILLTILSILIFKYTYAKLDFICMMFGIIIFLIHKLICDNKLKGNFIVIWEKFWRIAALWSMPIATVFFTVLSLLYNPNNAFLSKLNNLLVGRLKLSHDGLLEYGVKLFGQEIKWIGITNKSDGKYNFIDSLYHHYAIQSGLIIIALFILAYVLIAKKYKDNMKVLYILVLISLHAIVEEKAFNIYMNPFTILLFADSGLDFLKSLIGNKRLKKEKVKV